MTSFAIVERARLSDPAGVLMLLDSRPEADDIAQELLRRGQQVDVVELRAAAPAVG